VKTQEHDATLEIISPHNAEHFNTTLMQCEQETQILFTTYKDLNSPTNQNQNYFWQMNAV